MRVNLDPRIAQISPRISAYTQTHLDGCECRKDDLWDDDVNMARKKKQKKKQRFFSLRVLIGPLAGKIPKGIHSLAAAE